MGRLVLTRRMQESIVITAADGTRIVVTYSEGQGQIRLAIDAPASVRIDREEVHNRKQAEKSAL